MFARQLSANEQSTKLQDFRTFEERERMANYFLEAAESIFGGKEWQIIFRTRPKMILAGKEWQTIS